MQEARYKESYAALTVGCYWDYVRVYVPPGSVLTQAQWGDADPQIVSSVEYSRTAFAAFLTVAPSETRTLTLQYTVPYTATSASHSYDLAVRKQPGTDQVPLTLAVRLPTGGVLHGARPPASGAPDGWIHYDPAPLIVDRIIHLGW